MTQRIYAFILMCVIVSFSGCSTDPATVIEPDVETVDFTVPVRELNDRVSVMTWKNGAAAALSLTFDDGTEDHYRIAAPVMERHGLRGTFFLTVGSVGSGVWKFGTWDGFLALQDSGHELASHTMTHPWLTKIPRGDAGTTGTQLYELTRSREVIEARTGRPCLSFAYPYCDHNPAVELLCRDIYPASRTGRLNPANPVWNNPTPDDWSLIVSYVPWFGTAPRTNPANDIPVLTQAGKVVNAAVEQNGWAVFQLHSVVPFREIVSGGYMNDLTLGENWFELLCTRLEAESARGALWVDTMGNVNRYIRERDAAVLTGYSETPAGLRFSLTGSPDNAVYNLPLTVEVSLPAGFNAARLTVPGGRIIALVSDPVNPGRLRFEVIPDGGEYILVYTNS